MGRNDASRDRAIICMLRKDDATIFQQTENAQAGGNSANRKISREETAREIFTPDAILREAEKDITDRSWIQKRKWDFAS